MWDEDELSPIIKRPSQIDKKKKKQLNLFVFRMISAVHGAEIVTVGYILGPSKQ